MHECFRFRFRYSRCYRRYGSPYYFPHDARFRPRRKDDSSVNRGKPLFRFIPRRFRRYNFRHDERRTERKTKLFARGGHTWEILSFRSGKPVSSRIAKRNVRDFVGTWDKRWPWYRAICRKHRRIANVGAIGRGDTRSRKIEKCAAWRVFSPPYVPSTPRGKR